jgi:hypothetical protein
VNVSSTNGSVCEAERADDEKPSPAPTAEPAPAAEPTPAERRSDSYLIGF